MDVWIPDGGRGGDELEDWNWHINTIDTVILQGDQTNPKGNQPWIFNERTDAKAEPPIPEAKSEFIGKDFDAGKDRRQEEKGMTGQDGWMASPTRWTWVWASSRRWWRTGEPGMLQSMGLQRVGHDWVTGKQQLCIKETANENPLYSTGSSTQCSRMLSAQYSRN